MEESRAAPAPALSAEAAVARITPWQGRNDISISALAGGITNLNYRLDVGGESFVLRIGGADTDLLGIDRRCEQAAHTAAAGLGIAPEVFFVIQPQGYLVTRFIEGRPLSIQEIGRPENLQRVGLALRAYHALPPIACAFSPFRTVETFAQTAIERGVRLPDDYAELKDLLDQIERSMLANPARTRHCHNDLLNANFLDDGRLRILDWEYAGMGDPFFDLGNFAVHHELVDVQEQLLLECYFRGQATPAGVARLKLMKIASDFREAMWGVLQVGISQLDFDFRGYAEFHFSRMKRHLEDSRFPTWLTQAVGRP